MTKGPGYGKMAFAVMPGAKWGGRKERIRRWQTMFIIAGLGNPDKQYEGTRHNVGFDVIDRIAEKYNISVDTKKHRALIGKGVIEGQKVILAKPQTYMNNSGESVAAVMQFFKIPVEDLLVIYDDMDMPTGKLRLREKGSAGGHNGIKSIIAHVGTQNFKRIRVGISKNKLYSVVDWVLGHYSKEEEKLISEGAKHAAEAVLCYLDDGFNKAMNKFN